MQWWGSIPYLIAAGGVVWIATTVSWPVSAALVVLALVIIGFAALAHRVDQLEAHIEKLRTE